MIDPIAYYQDQGLGTTPFLKQSIAPQEWQYLHQAALECQGDILEIGVYFYSSATAFLSAMETNKRPFLFSVDYEHRRGWYRHKNPDVQKRWIRIIASSHDCLWTLDREDQPPLCTLIYIDGDHSAAGVQQDFKDCKRLLRSDGRILIHDTNSENLRKALFEIEPEANFRDVFRDTGTHKFGMMEWRPK